MLITSVYPNVTPYVGNPAVDMARRENQRRDIIEPVAQMERGAAEKGVISEDKSRNNSQLANATYNEDLKNRGTELKQAVEGRPQDSQRRENDSQDNAEQDNSAEQRGPKAEQQELAELESRDAEVKAHELAHATVGGQLASSPSFSYQQGPDGQRYAVSGEVQIDLSEVPGDPRATIIKMQQVKAAALAPAEPSAADRQVATEAAAKITAAQAELARTYIPINQPPALDPTTWIEQTTDEASQLGNAANFSNESSAEPAEKPASQPFSRYAGRDSRSLSELELMQLRSNVISQFYANATVPQHRPLYQTA